MDFEQLYKAYYMEVFSYLMTLAKDKELAEELTQKTFFKALNSLQSFRGQSSEFTWLCSIAKNLYIDETRQKKFSEELDEEVASEDNVEHTVENKDAEFRIHMVLHELEEPYKEVFQLRVFGELSFEKIGILFGKTENWARVTYHRSRLKIQERMEQK